MKSVDFLVVIPTHHRHGPLRTAIASALTQTGATKQIIVVDDNPDGAAADIVKEFAEVIYVKNPISSGGWPSRVRNFAFSYSLQCQISAKYVHFLDDDDTVPDGHYSVASQVFTDNPGIGVVFGILRPFCDFSNDPDIRRQQEIQLAYVRNWRMTTARYPWLYQRLGDMFCLPWVSQRLFWLHATFGWEMFLCSGAVIRHECVAKLGGFPDIRITEDHWFFTEAIRRYGVLFLYRETAGYGLGDARALYSALGREGEALLVHTTECAAAFNLRQENLRKEMGEVKYSWSFLTFRIAMKIFNQLLIPALNRLGFFERLYKLTYPAW